MPRSTAWGWAALIAAHAVLLWALCFEPSAAAPRNSAPSEPFANSVQQRAEMIDALREISDLLKEQNELLKSGSLQVVVAERPSP